MSVSTEKLQLLFRKSQKKKSPPLILKYGLKLGKRLRKEGQFGEATDVLSTTLLVQSKAHGEDNLDVASVMVALGDVYEADGNFARAISYYAKALPIQLEKLGVDDDTTAKTSLKLAAIEMHQQEYYEKALESFRIALDIKIRNVGEEHPTTATALMNIAVVYKQLNDFQRALEYLSQALAVRIKALGEQHPDTAECVTTLADVYRMDGDFEKALEYYEWAVSIRIPLAKASKTQSRLAGDCLFNIALIHRREENHKQSADAFTRAAHHFTQALGVDHSDAKDCLLQAKRAQELDAKMGSSDDAETAI